LPPGELVSLPGKLASFLENWLPHLENWLTPMENWLPSNLVTSPFGKILTKPIINKPNK
jgi:hypothetical protein